MTLDRGQSYDNTKNMSGEYEGLQAHVQKLTMLHSLYHAADIFFNQCGVHAMQCCLEAVNAFTFLQKWYSFFVPSAHRWAVISKIPRVTNDLS